MIIFKAKYILLKINYLFVNKCKYAYVPFKCLHQKICEELITTSNWKKLELAFQKNFDFFFCYILIFFFLLQSELKTC